MHSLLRLLLTWLIVLALPVQGMASMTMAHCGEGHERMQATLAEPGHHHDAHASAGAHHHDLAVADGADAHDALDRSGAADQQPAQPDEPGDLGTCSSCASCCAGSALPSVMPRIPEPPPATTFFIVDSVDIDAFATDGPDRPPRRRLA